ncbi:MAG: hypothetical protein HY812_13990 [Planctomycetes bacterium]|nr:hypothetical protein [Planctomycetota bacterium]
MTTGAGGTEVQDLSSAKGMLRPSEQQADKPFVVYLTSTDEKFRTAQDVVEKTTLKDERVAISAKFLTMIKSEGEAITKSHPYYQWIGGKELPRIVVFSSSGDKIGKLEGRASPSKLFALMEKAVTRHYDMDLDETIKDYQKILTEVDKLSVLKDALKEKRKGKLTSSETKKIEGEEKELADREKELLKQEEVLLNPKRKNAA